MKLPVAYKYIPQSTILFFHRQLIT